MLKVIFLSHSGFLLELEQSLLIFDYFRDPAGILEQYKMSNKPMFFFASHAHPDHFVPQIFDLQSKWASYYILDESCRSQALTYLEKSGRLEQDADWAEEHICFILAGEEWKLAEPSLQSFRAFPSTDEGSAFLLTTEAGRIFHAGDLNDWDWQDEDSPLMAEHFRSYVAQIKAYLGAGVCDYCFFPLDERLGATALKGPLHFLQEIPCRYFFTMHNFGENVIQDKLIAAVAEQGNTAGHRVKIMAPRKAGETFHLKVV